MSRPLSDSNVQFVHSIERDVRASSLYQAKVRQFRLKVELRHQQFVTYQFLTQGAAQHPETEQERQAELARTTLTLGELLDAGLGQPVRNAHRGVDSIAVLAELYESKQ